MKSVFLSSKQDLKTIISFIFFTAGMILGIFVSVILLGLEFGNNIPACKNILHCHILHFVIPAVGIVFIALAWYLIYCVWFLIKSIKK